MLPEIGHFALAIALCIALVQGVIPMIGAARRIPGWIAFAKPAAMAQFLFLAISYGLLTQAFIADNFSVSYVAMHSNSALPLMYRIAGVWGGHEGSLLLWALMLGGWTAAVAAFSRNLPPDMVARVIGVLGFVSVGFLAFIMFTSNPFERLNPAPLDGRDLNPLLQDPGLVFHPPMLYMGYVGFSVAFAFALAALISGRLDATWARWSRPWTIVAWVSLTLGISLGSWWAYYELGWGGWWFWDPVENASFLPWLAGTALMHSLATTEKRGAFKSWTVLLAIACFALCLLGTFLVRSGVLTSVHAFANDPSRGMFILGLLVVVVGTSLVIYAWRAPRVKSTAQFSLVSRETLILGNNILLVVATGSVLLGTIYPLILDAMDLGKISVGPPYFNAVFVPLMIPLIALMAFGPLVRWKEDDINRIVKIYRIPLVVSIVLGVLIPIVLFGNVYPMVAVGVVLAVWVASATCIDLWHRVKHKKDKLRGLVSQPASYWGMHIAHLGMAVTIVGIALTSYYSEERDVRMSTGDSVEVAGHTFTFQGVRHVEGPNFISDTATITVTKNGKDVATMHTEKRIYRVQTMPMTEAGIDPGLFRDLYVALGEQLPDGSWPVRVYVKPFVRWIWLGSIFMAVGGLLAVIDRRYRLATKRESELLQAVAQKELVKG